jgi:serine phosphatase RsbU (regulator of sigma subunit)
MSDRRQSIEAELGGLFGAVLAPVRWLVLLCIVASLQLPFGREIPIRRGGVLAAVVVYALIIAALPRLRGRALRRRALERLLLAADLWFSVAVFLVSGGILSPYFGLLYLALIHAALLLGPGWGLTLAVAAAALVLVSEVAAPGARGTILTVSFALCKLPYLPLVIWTAGRLAQEVRYREASLHQSERRAFELEAKEQSVRLEMEAARRVQESLLPAAMLLPAGLGAAALFHPAREVGGDIYELIELPDGQLLIAIADVSGKGMPAALLSVAVQHGFRQFAQPDPVAVLAGVNQVLLEKSPDGMFVTAVCVVIDPRDGSATAAVAGHPPPLRWESDSRRLVPLQRRGPALGLLPGWSGPIERWRLNAGDVLILYTDGVVDAKIGPKERLGEERFAGLLADSAPEGSQKWIERLRAVLGGSLEWSDDVTIIAIEWEPSLAAVEVPVGGADPIASDLEPMEAT